MEIMGESPALGLVVVPNKIHTTKSYQNLRKPTAVWLDKRSYKKDTAIEKVLLRLPEEWISMDTSLGN
jgi:hypothetical protein